MPTTITTTTSNADAITAINAESSTVTFEAGTHALAKLPLRAGLTYILTGATINLPATAAIGDRIFESYVGNQHLYSSDTDSDETTIIDGVLDGQYAPASPNEQQHGIYCSADPSKAGRLVVNIQGTEFKGFHGDGIHLRFNADVTASNITDTSCERAGIAITGGNSKLYVRDYTSTSGKAFDAEVDSTVAAEGYGIEFWDRIASDITGENWNIAGKFDVGIRGNSTATFDNIRSTGTGFVVAAADASTYTLRNSDIKIGATINPNRIVWAHNILVEDTIFRLDSYFPIYWSTSGIKQEKNKIRFNNVTIVPTGTVTTTQAIQFFSFHDSDNDVSAFEAVNLTIADSYTVGIASAAGRFGLSNYTGPDHDFGSDIVTYIPDGVCRKTIAILQQICPYNGCCFYNSI